MKIRDKGVSIMEKIMIKQVTTEELAGALKGISMGLIEKENQTTDEICLGIEFFELWGLDEGANIMWDKLGGRDGANKIYKKWQKDEARRRANNR
jgi:hypothetical protein